MLQFMVTDITSQYTKLICLFIEIVLLGKKNILFTSAKQL